MLLLVPEDLDWLRNGAQRRRVDAWHVLEYILSPESLEVQPPNQLLLEHVRYVVGLGCLKTVVSDVVVFSVDGRHQCESESTGDLEDLKLVLEEKVHQVRKIAYYAHV